MSCCIPCTALHATSWHLYRNTPSISGCGYSKKEGGVHNPSPEACQPYSCHGELSHYYQGCSHNVLEILCRPDEGLAVPLRMATEYTSRPTDDESSMSPGIPLLSHQIGISCCCPVSRTGNRTSTDKSLHQEWFPFSYLHNSAIRNWYHFLSRRLDPSLSWIPPSLMRFSLCIFSVCIF